MRDSSLLFGVLGYTSPSFTPHLRAVDTVFHVLLFNS